MGFTLCAEIGKSAFECSHGTAWAGLGFWDESEISAAALVAEKAALPQSKGSRDLNTNGGQQMQHK